MTLPIDSFKISSNDKLFKDLVKPSKDADIKPSIRELVNVSNLQQKLTIPNKVYLIDNNELIEKYMRDFKVLVLVEDAPENSIFRKILACIPLLGIIPTIINEDRLRAKIQPEKDSATLVTLIEVKNRYKVASIIRGLLSMALLVTGIATGIFGSLGLGLAICGLIVAGCCISEYAYRIHKNKHIIEILQKTNKLSGLW